MMRREITFQGWLRLTPKERAKVYRSWNPYAGDGEPIVKEAHRLFEEKFEACSDVVETSYGVYHGGDWVIAPTLKVGYRVEIMKAFLGILVVKLYGGISDWLKRRLKRVYANDIARFVRAEHQEFSRCFNFTDSPYGRRWLRKFVKEYI